MTLALPVRPPRDGQPLTLVELIYLIERTKHGPSLDADWYESEPEEKESSCQP